MSEQFKEQDQSIWSNPRFQNAFANAVVLAFFLVVILLGMLADKLLR